MRVLIADDSKLARAILRDHCEEFFKETTFYEATDGKEAIDIIYTHAIDIFISDLNMPDFDGERVLNTLRANERFNTLKIIMITSESSREVILPLLRKGLNGYVQKPVHKEDLFKLLRKLHVAIMYESLSEKSHIEVLVCDDSMAERIFIKAALRETLGDKLQIYEASNGYEALNIMNIKPIKLVMIDWNMPVKDGSEVIHSIRQNQLYNDVKIVVVSSEKVKKELSSDIKSKINGFLEKPIESQKFHVLLRSLVKRFKREAIEERKMEEGINILIADDSRVIRKVLNAFLDEYFVTPNIYEANDGFEALDIIDKHNIHYLFLDYHMPNMDGAGVLEMLKACNEEKKMKVIMVTGTHDNDTIKKFRKLGINSFVKKPITMQSVTKALDMLLMKKA